MPNVSEDKTIKTLITLSKHSNIMKDIILYLPNTNDILILSNMKFISQSKKSLVIKGITASIYALEN